MTKESENAIHEALGRLQSQLNQIHEAVAEAVGKIGEIAGRCQSQCARTDKVLFGNGQPGLLPRLERVETIHMVLKWAAGLLIGGIFTVVAYAVYALLEHKPLIP